MSIKDLLECAVIVGDLVYRILFIYLLFDISTTIKKFGVELNTTNEIDKIGS